MQYLVITRYWRDYRSIQPDGEAEMVLAVGEPGTPDSNPARADAIMVADRYMRSADLAYANAVNQTLSIRPAGPGDLE